MYLLYFSMQLLPYKSFCLCLSYPAGNCGTFCAKPGSSSAFWVKIIFYKISHSSLFFSSVSVESGMRDPIISPSAVLGAQPVFCCGLSGSESIQPLRHEKTWGWRFCSTARDSGCLPFLWTLFSCFQYQQSCLRLQIGIPGVPWCTWFSSGSEDCFLHTVCVHVHIKTTKQNTTNTISIQKKNYRIQIRDFPDLLCMSIFMQHFLTKNLDHQQHLQLNLYLL